MNQYENTTPGCIGNYISQDHGKIILHRNIRKVTMALGIGEWAYVPSSGDNALASSQMGKENLSLFPEIFKERAISMSREIEYKDTV